MTRLRKDRLNQQERSDMANEIMMVPPPIMIYDHASVDIPSFEERDGDREDGTRSSFDAPIIRQRPRKSLRRMGRLGNNELDVLLQGARKVNRRLRYSSDNDANDHDHSVVMDMDLGNEAGNYNAHPISPTIKTQPSVKRPRSLSDDYTAKHADAIMADPVEWRQHKRSKHDAPIEIPNTNTPNSFARTLHWFKMKLSLVMDQLDVIGGRHVTLFRRAAPMAASDAAVSHEVTLAQLLRMEETEYDAYHPIISRYFWAWRGMANAYYFLHCLLPRTIRLAPGLPRYNEHFLSNYHQDIPYPIGRIPFDDIAASLHYFCFHCDIVDEANNEKEYAPFDTTFFFLPQPEASVEMLGILEAKISAAVSDINQFSQ